MVVTAAILVGGETLVDFIPLASEGRPTYRTANGGSPRNVAIALGRLGVPVGFFGGVSTDRFGAAIVSELADNGVDTAHVARLDRPTTLAFVSFEDSEPSYSFYDAEAADRYWRVEDMPRIDPSVRAMHFGSISLVRLPAASAFSALLKREADRRFISFDPNVRPDVVRDEEGYRRRLAGVLAEADMIKLSAADAAWIAPDRDPADLAAEWLSASACLIFLTLGKEGAKLFAHQGIVERPAIAANVVDTIGAGDSFVAGCLAALHDADALDSKAVAALAAADLTKILDAGLAAAALTCERAGADPPHRAELRAKLKGVEGRSSEPGIVWRRG
jgi:fructokinase